MTDAQTQPQPAYSHPLGRTQKQIVDFLATCGPEGGYIRNASRGGFLRGYYLEEVERSMEALIKRGVLTRLSAVRVAVTSQLPTPIRDE